MIQIFGTKKCNDTKKAERFFKERNIKFQFIDMKEKGMSKGELTSVASAVGGIDKLINENAKDKDMLALIAHMSGDDRIEKILCNSYPFRSSVPNPQPVTAYDQHHSYMFRISARQPPSL